MKSNTLFSHGGRWIFIGVITAVMLIHFLWACDPGNVSGPNPPLQDSRPLIPDPSWDCGMPEGIPTPELGQFVLRAELTLGSVHDMGQTQYGRRHVIEVTGGRINGPDITADVLTGGLDYQLTLANGAMEIDQVNVLRTADGHHIYFRNCGASADQRDVRMVADFEVPDSSPYGFLNTGTFVGTRQVDPNGRTMRLTLYDVSNVSVNPQAPAAIRVTQPDDVPDQSYDCREALPSEPIGEELFSETVDLGAVIEVGNSKYGNRKIMPITGGVVSGAITGSVLFGGADYQLYTGANITDIYLDARYTIRADDGELIIVRNCGPLAMIVDSSIVPTLAPSFETRVGSNYSYLNEGRWRSSIPVPNADQTAVDLKIFQSR